jgi:hypothetical protein
MRFSTFLNAFQSRNFGSAYVLKKYTASIQNIMSFISFIPVVASIELLLTSSCPTTIAGLVMAVIIDPIKTQILRPVSHIIVEIIKSEPSVTNINSSASIVFVMRILRAIAALNHPMPSVVDRVVALSMPKRSPEFSFAPTRMRCAIPETSRNEGFFFPARTSTKPFSKAFFCSWDASYGC